MDTKRQHGADVLRDEARIGWFEPLISVLELSTSVFTAAMPQLRPAKETNAIKEKRAAQRQPRYAIQR